VTPICPHKSVEVFQAKVPFDVKEKKKFAKVAWSFE